MKRKLFACALAVICLSLLAYGTLAYFTAEERAHNVITSGEIDIDLLEWADEERTTPFPEDGIHDVMPGTSVTKIVEVKNTGDNAAYVRVTVQKSIVLQPGMDGEPDSSLLQIEFDDSAWTLGEDGFYYYNKPLAPGAVTEPLFASVEFDPAMGNLYQNSTATVDVDAYAVQVANNGATVFDAKGWPALNEEVAD